MKKITFYFLLIIVPLVIFSCKDDEDPSASQDDLPGALVATIDGQSFDFRYQPRAYSVTSEVDGKIYDAISIRGATSANASEELNITIVNPVIGTLDLGPEALSFIFYTKNFENGSTETHGSVEGTITVTELGNRVKGTFNGTLSNQNSIDGSFNLVISE